jgi:ethanolamine utilization protein EutJ
MTSAMTDGLAPARAADLDATMAAVSRVLTAVPSPVAVGTPLRVGVDLGTAYTVVVVLAEDGLPLAAAYSFGDVVRDGVVTDFIGAVDLVRRLKAQVEAGLGVGLAAAHGAFPPGVPESEVRAVRHVIEACEMDCSGLIDEPSAANAVLGVRDGAVVDVGGGTTGIAVIRDGQVVHTADEATGGTHLSLVVAGAMKVPFEQAEALKQDPSQQARLFPVVRPVMEKVATIVARNTAGWPVPVLWLSGGSVAFPGFADVVATVTGIPTRLPPVPMFVTPLGIARSAPAVAAGYR